MGAVLVKCGAIPSSVLDCQAEFRGHASIFGVPNHAGDIVLPGAFG